MGIEESLQHRDVGGVDVAVGFEVAVAGVVAATVAVEVVLLRVGARRAVVAGVADAVCVPVDLVVGEVQEVVAAHDADAVGVGGRLEDDVPGAVGVGASPRDVVREAEGELALPAVDRRVGEAGR
jgi:hypothetical protein